jgi:predicted nucleic acid-binding protein
MPALVADASVLAAIAFGESAAQRARAELQGARLYEPSLLPYELASIARGKIRRDPDQRQLIMRALVIVLSIEMELIEVEQVAVVRLALASGLTTCDATYLHLARSLGVPLVTFDKQLRAAADVRSTSG